MIVGFSLDLLGGLGYALREGDSSAREGNRRDPLIGVGDDCTIVGFCLVPHRACWIRATASRTQMAMGIRCERTDSTVFSVELVNNRADGPCRKQVFSDLRLWLFPSNEGVPESTTMGPIGEAIVPKSAVRKDAAFVRSITTVDESIIARFSALIMVPEPVIGNCGPLIAL